MVGYGQRSEGGGMVYSRMRLVHYVTRWTRRPITCFALASSRVRYGRGCYSCCRSRSYLRSKILCCSPDGYRAEMLCRKLYDGASTAWSCSPPGPCGSNRTAARFIGSFSPRPNCARLSLMKRMPGSERGFVHWRCSRHLSSRLALLALSHQLYLVSTSYFRHRLR
jgi:hypothetical protein